MRLVSQNGIFDIPYEMVSIYFTKTGDKYEIRTEAYPLAYYSTREKSLKVMEMVRDEYTGKPFVVSMNHKLTDEEIKEIAKGNVVSTFDYSNYFRATSGNNNTVFQFPLDEEVEV